MLKVAASPLKGDPHWSRNFLHPMQARNWRKIRLLVTAIFSVFTLGAAPLFALVALKLHHRNFIKKQRALSYQEQTTQTIAVQTGIVPPSSKPPIPTSYIEEERAIARIIRKTKLQLPNHPLTAKEKIDIAKRVAKGENLDSLTEALVAYAEFATPTQRLILLTEAETKGSLAASYRLAETACTSSPPKLEDAARHLEKFVATDSTLKKHQWTLGLIYEKLGKEEEALKVYRKILTGIKEDEAFAIYEGLGTQISLDASNERKKWLQQALSSKHPGALYLKAKELKATGKEIDCIAHLRLAAEKDYPPALEMLLDIAIDKSEKGEVKKWSDRLRNLERPDFLYALAKKYESSINIEGQAQMQRFKDRCIDLHYPPAIIEDALNNEEKLEAILKELNFEQTIAGCIQLFDAQKSTVKWVQKILDLAPTISDETLNKCAPELVNRHILKPEQLFAHLFQGMGADLAFLIYQNFNEDLQFKADAALKYATDLKYPSAVFCTLEIHVKQVDWNDPKSIEPFVDKFLTHLPYSSLEPLLGSFNAYTFNQCLELDKKISKLLDQAQILGWTEALLLKAKKIYSTDPLKSQELVESAIQKMTPRLCYERIRRDNTDPFILMCNRLFSEKAKKGHVPEALKDDFDRSLNLGTLLNYLIACDLLRKHKDALPSKYFFEWTEQLFEKLKAFKPTTDDELQKTTDYLDEIDTWIQDRVEKDPSASTKIQAALLIQNQNGHQAKQLVLQAMLQDIKDVEPFKDNLLAYNDAITALFKKADEENDPQAQYQVAQYFLHTQNHAQALDYLHRAVLQQFSAALWLAYNLETDLEKKKSYYNQWLTNTEA